jgi:hypothetical protein
MTKMTKTTILTVLLATLLAASPAPVVAQTCTPAQACGDINDADGVTVVDALGVLRRAIGLPVTLSCSCTGGDECPIGGLVETGLAVCWDPLDTVNPVSKTPCAGTRQDGDLRAGVPFDFVDNGDGTITDRNTTLMWEKLSDDNSIHDQDYTQHQWAGAFYEKVEQLNDEAFAGHNDWRVPNVKELSTLIDYSFTASPTVPAIFNNLCKSGCTVTNCSCTKGSQYWTSTSLDAAGTAGGVNAWVINFQNAVISTEGKTQYNFVRAVRGGY